MHPKFNRSVVQFTFEENIFTSPDLDQREPFDRNISFDEGNVEYNTLARPLI